MGSYQPFKKLQIYPPRNQEIPFIGVYPTETKLIATNAWKYPSGFYSQWPEDQNCQAPTLSRTDNHAMRSYSAIKRKATSLRNVCTSQKDTEWTRKHSRVHTVWSHLYQVLEKTKPSYEDLKRVAASGREMSGKGHVGNLRDDGNILHLSGGKVTWV